MPHCVMTLEDCAVGKQTRMAWFQPSFLLPLPACGLDGGCERQEEALTTEEPPVRPQPRQILKQPPLTAPSGSSVIRPPPPGPPQPPFFVHAPQHGRAWAARGTPFLLCLLPFPFSLHPSQSDLISVLCSLRGVHSCSHSSESIHLSTYLFSKYFLRAWAKPGSALSAKGLQWTGRCPGEVRDIQVTNQCW